MLKLPIVNFVSQFPLVPAQLLVKSEKAIEFMIPTPLIPTVGAN
jgi:hypothetical protein